MVSQRADQLRWLSHLERNVLSAVGSGPHGYHSIDQASQADFPKGLPEHVVWMLVGGTCRVTTPGRALDLQPGSVLWMKPQVPFSLCVASKSPMTLYRFRLSAMPEVDNSLEPVLFLADCWDLRSTFDTLVSELDAELPLHAKRLHGLLLVLFTSFFRLGERSTGNPLDSARRRKVQEYVDNHIGERITVAELAAAASLSPTRFARKFRHTFSVPPRTWILQRRIQYAALLIDTSTKTITQIARTLGYRDVYLFSRQFKRVMGVSPRAYQKRGR